MKNMLKPVSKDDVDWDEDFIAVQDMGLSWGMISGKTGKPMPGARVRVELFPLEGQPLIQGARVGGGFARQIYYALTPDAAKKMRLTGGFVTLGEYAPLDRKFKDGTTLFEKLSNCKTLLGGADGRWHWDEGNFGDGYGFFTFPHKTTEELGDDPEVRERFIKRLMPKLEATGMKVQLLGARRRYLLQVAPGTYREQTIYKTVVPFPATSPFNEKGQLSSRFREHYPPEVVNEFFAKHPDGGETPWPEGWNDKKHAHHGDRGVVPLLYKGPAWVIRFLLDDQDPVAENRVWVTDEADFIASDWCQRHNYTTYGRGSDWQSQEFDLTTWITVGLVKRQKRYGVFEPKSIAIEHFALRDLEKQVKSGLPDNGTIRGLQDRLLEYEFLGSASPVVEDGITYHPFDFSTTLEAERDASVTDGYDKPIFVKKGEPVTFYLSRPPNLYGFPRGSKKAYNLQSCLTRETAGKLFAKYESVINDIRDLQMTRHGSLYSVMQYMVVNRASRATGGGGHYTPSTDEQYLKELGELLKVVTVGAVVGAHVAVPQAGVDENDLLEENDDDDEDEYNDEDEPVEEEARF